MFGISGFELLIIVAFVLLIFGPEKLPEVGRLIGRGMGMFKRAQEDMERVIRAEMYAPEKRSSARRDASVADEVDDKAAVTAAGSIWTATDEDDEEEDEE